MGTTIAESSIGFVNIIGEWSTPSIDLELKTRGLHVWCASLDITAEDFKAFWRSLAADERVRADRFRFKRAKNHYVAARGLLRALLGRYLDIPPDQLKFAYSEYGKPVLDSKFHTETLHFNLAHAHGMGLFAFCKNNPVGVDIEKIRPFPKGERIAARFFSEFEMEKFKIVPATLRDAAFFNCWTRKEAYIKAIGEGLSCPLDQFDVTLTPGEPARIMCIQGSEREAARWSLHSLTPMSGYVGAVALLGKDWRLSCWRWPTNLSRFINPSALPTFQETVDK